MSSQGHSPYQRRSHKLVMTSGYRFIRNGSGHNVYRNDHGQTISVPSSPKNEGHAKRFLTTTIKQHDKEREARTMATQTASNVTRMLSLADEFLMKDPGDDKHAITARSSALSAWLRRAVEKYGPVTAADLLEATRQMGFNDHQMRLARSRTNLTSYKTRGGNGGTWMVALPEQIPSEYKPRETNYPKHEIAVEAPEDTAVGEIVAQLAEAPTVIGETVVIKTQNGNGNHDTQAAALLLLESLGIKQPGEDARQQIKAAMHEVKMAATACDTAYLALSATLEALA